MAKVENSKFQLHKCETCGELTPFPRYNDLNILLKTRSGRCGEWANVFTLLCHAIGWDARYVLDETDHVWTEVYSESQKRWLHCDPCENVCDTPLMYEHGWGKKLTYVIAYSPAEVQDVTWRYTSSHAQVLKRRNQCSETDLIKTLVSLRDQSQKQLPQQRRNHLTMRLLTELVELMIERKPNESEQQGRTSGSLAWRLTRGETRIDSVKSYVWNVTNEELENEHFLIKYCTATNKYERISNGANKIAETVTGWENGTFKISNIFRKEEKDWKMVYLARTESSKEGYISWKIAINKSKSKVIHNIDLKFERALYENGVCHLEIIGDDQKFESVLDANFCTSNFKGCKVIEIIAKLSGGKGNVAWQHAQLFRQSTSESNYPFILKISFADV